MFGISNKGLGAIKVLIMVGSIVVGFSVILNLKILYNLSNTELINEYKDQVKSLTDKVKELTKELEDKDAKIKRQLILLEQKDQDIEKIKQKIDKTRGTKRYMSNETLRGNGLRHEGYRNKVYRDTLGFKTIGVGHLCLPEENWNENVEYLKKINGSI